MKYLTDGKFKELCYFELTMYVSTLILFLSVFGACHCDISWVLEDKILDFALPLKSDEIDVEIAEEVKMEATVMIAHYGYRAENHTVQTKDGYLLGLHRIPKSKTGSLPTQPFPVLLQHGVQCCSGVFIDNANDSLAFFLADLGYDVWLGNIRGNRYSRKHMTLSPTEDAFWDFSWDEHAAYDLPIIIDYIRYHTGINQILLVSHSMATTFSFAMLASQPDYNDKIKGLVALGPVGSVTYIPSFLRFAAASYRVLESAVNLGGFKQFNPHTHLLESVLTRTCPSTNSGICNVIITIESGFDPSLGNKTRIPIYASDCIAGTSIKVLVHLAQLFESGEMSHFDYGSAKNMLVYGQPFPPKYVLSKITTPIVLIHAANDALADPMDVELLRRKLKSVILKELFPLAVGTHSAFFWLTDGPRIFYNRLAEILKMLQER